jgi:hypothetical protein
MSIGSGAGGSGGTIAAAPMPGSPPPSVSSGGGGGGGAVGRIFVNTSPLVKPMLGATISPAPKVSLVCATVNRAAPNPCVYP